MPPRPWGWIQTVNSSKAPLLKPGKYRTYQENRSKWRILRATWCLKCFNRQLVWMNQLVWKKVTLSNFTHVCRVWAFLFCFLTRSSFSCGAALLYVGLFCCQEAFVAAAVLIYICLLVAGSVLILRCGCVDICGFVPSGGQLWGLPSISWPHPGGKGGEGWVRWITTRREGEGGR